jgi:hypothetical protein
MQLEYFLEEWMVFWQLRLQWQAGGCNKTQGVTDSRLCRQWVDDLIGLAQDPTICS